MHKLVTPLIASLQHGHCTTGNYIVSNSKHKFRLSNGLEESYATHSKPLDKTLQHTLELAVKAAEQHKSKKARH